MSATTTDSDFSVTAVPPEARRGYWSMLVVMLGFTFFSASMWSGGKLGLGLSFGSFCLAVLFGNVILGAYTGALAYAATKTGLSTHLLARYAFGKRGSYLASALLGLTQVGWFGVGVAMFALPVQKVTGLPLYVLIPIGGAMMTATAFLGISALTVLSFIAVPSIAALGGYSMVEAIGSIEGSLFALVPKEPMSMALAVTICVGSFISGGTLTPDFARFNTTPKNAVSTTVIAFFLGNSLMFAFGAIGALATGEADVSEVMLKQGLIIPAVLVLGLNIWTTNDNALYASGLGFSNITGIPKSKLVLLNGAVGTLLAMWLYNNFVGFLTLLGSTLPPIGAVILADYFVVRRGSYDALENASFVPVKWTGIAAWGIGVIAAMLPGLPPVNGLIGSAVAYVVLSRVAARAPTPSLAG